MTTESVRLSAEELRIVQALMTGGPATLSSAHRLRLELLGLLKDGPQGPKLTDLGRRHAGAPASPRDIADHTSSTSDQRVPAKRDRAGRRLPYSRALPFP